MTKVLLSLKYHIYSGYRISKMTYGSKEDQYRGTG